MLGYICECVIHCSFLCLFFFFFKQKTAYEMRISDWSSDVCSSDLATRLSGGGAVIVADEMVARDQLRLARHGCYAELSSAAALTGLELLLKDEVISPDETVALIATSNGYKELASDESDR